jgi:predicted naringenin-chalcone synthase
MTQASIAGVGVAHPPSTSQEELWRGYFEQHYAGVAPGLAKRIFANSGVRNRHGVVNPLVEDPSQWTTATRMRRYLTESLPLGKDALSTALHRAGVAASDIGQLVVCSCTGYVTPGLDILLARDLAMASDIRRVFVGHMGCYARTDATTADYMTWQITDLGFRMGLSPHVPDALARHVGPAVEELLDGTGLATGDIAAWAVHPGGPRILDVVRDRLGLPGSALDVSAGVLAEHGNCSSATVLIILDELLRRPEGLAGPSVAMAFGPGLTLYAALLG